MTFTAADYEKLGVFYLGRPCDPATGSPRDEPLLYDSKDLTTHAVCVGMTGSGKTGLCMALLEEAAIDGIPVLAIDPKGDLSNLLLTFPGLRPEDFRPWVDAGEATRHGATVEAWAGAVAQRWREGLAAWGQDGTRIERLRAAAPVTVYTPGSNAGAGLTPLRSLEAPSAAVMADPELYRGRVTAAAAAVLALLGIDADPLRSREQILIATLLDQAWRAGRSLDLPALVHAIQKPPLDRVGVLDLESFFPARERATLAALLNNLLASPGFAGWLEGAPMDVQRLLYTADGKPRVAVISIAHLTDAERMFVVTLLLEEVLAWMRAQPGSASLRSILYMDEVFGYFPPVQNPPSKLPMLTLLKQARAFGLGVVLATQNPVDLDYKGLANCGTWFLGRLQTERDKLRVLDGLEGAASTTGRGFDREAMDRTLSGLAPRSFVLNDVHEDGPVLFQTRWCLSYLRGPMTRAELAAFTRAEAPADAEGGAPMSAATLVGGAGARPVLPPGVGEQFVVPRAGVSGRLIYRPYLHGSADVHYVDKKLGIDHWERALYLMPLDHDPPANAWEQAEQGTGELTLTPHPMEGVEHLTLAAAALDPKAYARWEKQLKAVVYQARPLRLLFADDVGLGSLPGEAEGAFRVRLRAALHEERDRAVERVRASFAPRLARLNAALVKAAEKLGKERADQVDRRQDQLASVGTGVLGALFGRKLASVGNVRAVAQVAKGARRAAREAEQAEQAEARRDELVAALAALEAEAEAALGAVPGTDEARLALVPRAIPPRKADITVRQVGLVWAPWVVGADGTATAAI